MMERELSAPIGSSGPGTVAIPPTSCRTVDLHRHSLASDGKLSPVELVAAAARSGMEAVGITDHETLSGLEPAIEEGLRRGVEVVPGIEIPVRFGDDGTRSMVGLFVDPRREAHLAVPGCGPLTAAGIAERRCAHVPRGISSPARGIQLIRELGGLPLLVEPGDGAPRTRSAILEDLAHQGLAGVVSPRRPWPTVEQELEALGMSWVPGSDDHDGVFSGGTGLPVSADVSDTTGRQALDRLRGRFLSGRPNLVVLSGLPGCGKSHLSEILQRLLGAPPICLDVLRERLFPIQDVGPQMKYARHVTNVIYELAQEQARSRLAAGRVAILDGTYVMTSGREDAARLMGDAGGEVLFIKVTAPDEVVEGRLGSRMRRDKGSDHASDAGIDIFRIMKEKLERGDGGWADVEEDHRRSRLPGSLLVIDTHSQVVTPVTRTRLSLALAFALTRHGYALGARR